MKDVIWLTITRNAVIKMTKGQPQLRGGEICAKVNVQVDPEAFKLPVIERTVHITDWLDGTDLADVSMKIVTITEEEAEVIRQRRLAKMKEILEEHGFEVTPALMGEEETPADA